jgi:hypothetical protein
MKKSIAIITVLAIMTIAALALSGCGDTGKAERAIALYEKLTLEIVAALGAGDAAKGQALVEALPAAMEKDFPGMQQSDFTEAQIERMKVASDKVKVALEAMPAIMGPALPPTSGVAPSGAPSATP